MLEAIHYALTGKKQTQKEILHTIESRVRALIQSSVLPNKQRVLEKYSQKCKQDQRLLKGVEIMIYLTHVFPTLNFTILRKSIDDNSIYKVVLHKTSGKDYCILYMPSEGCYEFVAIINHTDFLDLFKTFHLRTNDTGVMEFEILYSFTSEVTFEYRFIDD